MKKTEYNLKLLTVIFVVSLIISNVVTSKLVNTGLYFGGSLNKGISNTSFPFKTNGELNNQKEIFLTKELEVYQVIIN